MTEVWVQADVTGWEAREARETLLPSWMFYRQLWKMADIKGGERQGRIFMWNISGGNSSLSSKGHLECKTAMCFWEKTGGKGQVDSPRGSGWAT